MTRGQGRGRKGKTKTEDRIGGGGWAGWLVVC